MKALSKMAVTLIVIIILAVILLYVAWTRGWLAFIGPVSEAECYSDVQKACSNAQTTGSYIAIQSVLTRCKSYISKFASCSYCESNTAPQGSSVEDECRNCCLIDLPKWTPS